MITGTAVIVAAQPSVVALFYSASNTQRYARVDVDAPDRKCHPPRNAISSVFDVLLENHPRSGLGAAL
jgi:hypothetical protein